MSKKFWKWKYNLQNPKSSLHRFQGAAVFKEHMCGFSMTDTFPEQK